MSGGQTVDAEEMARARAKLVEALEGTRGQANELSATRVTKQDMGQAFAQYHAKYKECVDEARKAMNGLAGALDDYAEAVGTGGRSYSDTDGSAAGAVSREGRAL